MHFFGKESELENREKSPAPLSGSICEPCHDFCTFYPRPAFMDPPSVWGRESDMPSALYSRLLPLPLARSDPELGGQPSSLSGPQTLTLFTRVERWRAQPSLGSSRDVIIKCGFTFCFFLNTWQPGCLFLPLAVLGITQIVSSGLSLLNCEMGAARYSTACLPLALPCQQSESFWVNCE